MPLSIQKRWEIVFLHLHKLGPKLSLNTIAKELHYSPTTVKNRSINIRKQEISRMKKEEDQKGKLQTRRIQILSL
jgi:hypothetical protein